MFYVGVPASADCCCAAVLTGSARHPESDVDSGDCGRETDDEAGSLHVGWLGFFVDELEVVQCCCGGGGLMLSSRSFRKVSTSDFMFRSEDQDAQETLHLSM